MSLSHSFLFPHKLPNKAFGELRGGVAQDPLTQFGFFFSFMAAFEQMVCCFCFSFAWGTSGTCYRSLLGLDSPPWWVHFSPHMHLESFLGHRVSCQALGVLGRWLAPATEAVHSGPARAISGGPTLWGAAHEWEEEF